MTGWMGDNLGTLLSPTTKHMALSPPLLVSSTGMGGGGGGGVGGGGVMGDWIWRGGIK